MLGVTAGVLIRRTLPAMAVTLVVFTGIRLAISLWVRPILFAPLRVVSPFVLGTGDGAPPLPGAVKPGDWVPDRADHQRGRAGHRAVRRGRGKRQHQFPREPRSGQPRRRRTLPEYLPRRRPGRRHFPHLDATPRRPSTSPRKSASTSSASAKSSTYQPLNHYWPLQWFEALIFLGLAVALVGLCLWRVRRSLT